MTGAFRALGLTFGSALCAFDAAGRMQLQRWYFSGPQCAALEPGEVRRARRRMQRDPAAFLRETR